MFKILITSGETKHSIAIQKYLKISIPDVYLIVQENSKWNSCKLYGHADIVKRCSLDEALYADDFDMVIPVGGKDIRPTLKYANHKAILPSPESLERCLNKWQTLQLAKYCKIPVPYSIHVNSLNALENKTINFPCVIKSACEVEAKFVFYAKNQDEFNDCLIKAFKLIGETSKYGIIIQEYVSGIGVGFFALYSKGTPVRIYMHQRIREWPITGGGSTAARSYYNQQLKNYGITLLNALEWNGIAMVEFKYNYEKNEFFLMEINPKFWGSVELALLAGVNFPADMVRIYRGASLPYSEDYNMNQHFYWPLDDDILNLWKTKKLCLIKDYFNSHAATNMGGSKLVDFLKFLRIFKKIIIK